MFYLNQVNKIQKKIPNFKEIKCKEVDISLFYFSVHKKNTLNLAHLKKCMWSEFNFKSLRSLVLPFFIKKNKYKVYDILKGQGSKLSSLLFKSLCSLLFVEVLNKI